MRFLREERDRHVDLLEKLNFRISFGAAVVLATVAFGANDLGQLGARLNACPISICTALALIGAVCIAWALIIHWNFRSGNIQRCADAMRAIAKGELAWDKFMDPERAFAALPAHALFPSLLAIGVIALLLSGVLVVGAAIMG